MDLGLYNKSWQARGSHGTLINNYVEERALADQTGYARHQDFAQEKNNISNANYSLSRVIRHFDDDTRAPKSSMTHTTYQTPSETDYQQTLKEYNKQKWEISDRASVVAGMKSNKTYSQIQFGSESFSVPSPFKSTYQQSHGRK